MLLGLAAGLIGLDCIGLMRADQIRRASRIVAVEIRFERHLGLVGLALAIPPRIHTHLPDVNSSPGSPELNPKP